MNCKYPDIESLKQRFFDKFPNNELKLLSLEKNRKVIVETKYGNCLCDMDSILWYGITNIKTYGTKDADISGVADNSKELLEVNMLKGTGIQNIKTNLVGSYNLPNVLAAIAVGKYFNVPDDKIKKALESYTPSNSRSHLSIIRPVP